VYALDYFMARDRRFLLRHRIVLRWSLLGHILYSVATGAFPLAFASCMVLLRLMVWRNPVSDSAARPGNEPQSFTH
jgi:hypothetical protein